MSRSSYRTLPVLLLSAGFGLAVHACKPDSPTAPDDNRAPTASIVSPANASSYTTGESISFAGGATDPEDGVLAGTFLVWTSSLDGRIGTGGAFSRSDLSVGTHTIRLIATDSKGKSDTATVSIGISDVPNELPTASFSFSCSSLTCTFTDGSSDPDGTIAAWAWQFGDGATSNQQNPQHTYAAGGTFNVVLTVTDNGGATDDLMRPVSVTPQNQGPTASFTVVCDLLACTFTDASTDSDGTVEAWSWTFGDGATSDQQNPAHTYASGSTYQVSLTVTDNDGATGQFARQVTPNEKPVAAITAPAGGSVFVLGSSVGFSGSGTDPEDGSLTGASLQWQSSLDGNIGSGVSFSKSNLTVGVHTIRLIATDSDGDADTATVSIRINSPPTASITAPSQDTTATQGDAVAFAGTGSDPENGALTGASLQWQSSLDGSIGSGVSFSKSNLTVGVHTIRLIATDGDAAKDTATVTVTITSPANQPPTAAITAPSQDTTATQGDAVAFAGTGTDPEDGALTGASLQWQSSLDGSIGSGVSFSKSNLTVGVHTIRLIATDGDAASDTATVTVTITSPANQPPTASITSPADGSSFTAGTNVSFRGTGVDPEDGLLSGVQLVWTSDIQPGGPFGTGSPTNENGLIVGTHLITLTVTDTDGATGTDQISVTITSPANQAPTAAITAPSQDTTATQGDPVAFAGTGSDPEDGSLIGTSLQWQSSLDGGIGSGVSFSKSNLTVGVHTIRLIATDGDAASDTATVTVIIVAPANQAPTASITAPSQDTTATQGDPVAFAGTGSDPEDGSLTGGSLQWQSSLDGGIGSGVSFSKSNLTVGVHTIRLIATDGDAASDTATVTVTIETPPNQAPAASIAAPSQDTTATQGDAVAFAGTGSDPEDGSLTGGSLQWQSSLDGGIGSGVSFSKSNLTVGVHTIRLIATDGDAASDTATVTVTIETPPNQAPAANFASSCTNLVCDFTDTSTDPDGTVTGWAWDFGDSEVSSQKNPQHTYTVGGPYTVTLVATDNQAASDTVTKSVSLSSPILPGYQIEVRESPGVTLTASQRTAVENAAARWESLVTADLLNIPWAAAAGLCGGATVPALNETVDDLVIYLEFVPIDGVGGILGSAGPCLIRGAGNLPFLGGMKFDTADLANLEAQGRLEAVIVHEMGHVLGIGTLWNLFGLLNDPTSPSPAPINDTWFSGAAATAAFNSIGGAGYGGGEIIPVENNNAIYGTGSLNGHWRESVFTTELMTPSIGVGASPLSVVTSESLSDLGYAVNSATADPFTLSFDLVDTEQPPALLLIDDIWMGPIEIVDTQGRVTGSFRAF